MTGYLRAKSLLDIVKRESHPIEPLGYIMKSSEFPRLPQQKTAQLRSIDFHIFNYTSQISPKELTPSAKAYAQERGQYITLSLKNLAQASLSTARKVGKDDVTLSTAYVTRNLKALKHSWELPACFVCSLFTPIFALAFSHVWSARHHPLVPLHKTHVMSYQPPVSQKRPICGIVRIDPSRIEEYHIPTPELTQRPHSRSASPKSAGDGQRWWLPTFQFLSYP